jgi:tetratricopeptide (TPR) repeat protein
MENMATITQTNAPNRNISFRFYSGALVAACCASALFAVILFQEVVRFYPLNQATVTLLRNQEVRTEEQQIFLLSTLSTFKNNANNFSLAAANDYGYLSMLASQWQNPHTLQGRLYALDAKAPLEKIIQNNPSDAFAWSRLAYVYTTLLQPEKALAAWRMSIIAAPFEPKLLLWQVGFALPLYEKLNSTDQAYLRQQLLNAWKFSRWQTAKILADFERPDLLRTQLLAGTEEAVEFEKSYRYFLSVKEDK